MCIMGSYVQLFGRLTVLFTCLCLYNGIEAIKINVVLDGTVYEEEIQGDMCSIVEASDRAIVRSSKPFSSISVVPEQWVLFFKDQVMSILECDKNDELLESLNIKDGDYVYLFRSELAYLDPYYAAEYLKTFTKSFGDRIKPATLKAPSNKKSKSKSSTKKTKPKKKSNDVLLQAVGSIAKSILSGSLAQAFGIDTTGGSNNTESTKGNDIAKNEGDKNDQGEQAQLLENLVNIFGKPILEGYIKKSMEEHNEEF